MSNQLYILRSRRFLPLFVTQFLGAFNDNVFKNALLIWFTYVAAKDAGMDASKVVTLAGGLFILPFFLFSATAGQLADKYERSALARKLKVAEIVLMVLGYVFFLLGSVHWLLLLLALMGAQSAFFGPIKYSLLPEHLREDELIIGNGLVEASTFLAILLGTLFGGLVILADNGIHIFAICVISFAVIGYLASRHIPVAEIKAPQLEISWNIYAAIREFIGYAKVEYTVWLSILAISWLWLVGATFLTQLPTYTNGVIGGNEHIVTLFLTTFSLGIGVGSIWCNKLLGGIINGRLVPYGALGITVAVFLLVAGSYWYEVQRMAYLGEVVNANYNISLRLSEFFAVGLSSWAIVLCLLALAISSGVYMVPLYAIVQHRTAEVYLARVIATNNIMNSLFIVGATIVTLALYSFALTVLHLFLLVGLLNIPVYFIIRGVVKRRLKNA